MTAVRRTLVLLLAAGTGVLALAAPARAAAGPPPSSMASLGESISRGFNSCGFFVDCPSRSWSTGDDSAVNSQYLRIRAKNPAIAGHNNNDAKSGATSADLPAQAALAVSQRVDYVTILMGANDACTGAESTMTPVTTYRTRLDAALSALKSGLPGARVEVVSIPDIQRLWAAGKGNLLARGAWALFHICQSMLANPTSTAQADVDRRARVRQRVVDYNAELAQACAAYGGNCRFDGNAVFNYPFTLSQINGWDYFHPNTTGQAILAGVSYAAGFNW
jgi:lysophospholipase L1-like esterase